MSHGRMKELKRELEGWARARPRLPAAQARRRVMARLAPRRRRHGLVAATAAAATMTGIVLVLGDRPERLSGVAPDVQAALPRPGVLVYELESGAKLYVPLSTPADARQRRGGGR